MPSALTLISASPPTARPVISMFSIKVSNSIPWAYENEVYFKSVGLLEGDHVDASFLAPEKSYVSCSLSLRSVSRINPCTLASGPRQVTPETAVMACINHSGAKGL